MYRFLSNFYPKKLKENYVNLLRYSGIKLNAKKFIGFTIVFSFLLSLAVAFYLSLFVNFPFLVSIVGFFLLFQLFFYLWLVLKTDTKAKFVEKTLPDALQLMASNLRAGLTTDKALLLSARPEFGPLQEEINYVGKEITMGKNIGNSLLDMTKHIKSEKLSKTIQLIVSGLKTGGELASLLEQTSKNLRQEEIIDSRIRANVMMYVIFIFVAICLGAPLLFGLSSFLVGILKDNLGMVEIPRAAMVSLPVSFGGMTIDTGFILMFIVVFLVTTGILGSLILGLISKGREREGIKYMPFLITISLAVFFLVRFVIEHSLGGLFTP